LGGLDKADTAAAKRRPAVPARQTSERCTADVQLSARNAAIILLVGAQVIAEYERVERRRAWRMRKSQSSYLQSSGLAHLPQ
jgi:hypothetical protein